MFNIVCQGHLGHLSGTAAQFGPGPSRIRICEFAEIWSNFLEKTLACAYWTTQKRINLDIQRDELHAHRICHDNLLKSNFWKLPSSSHKLLKISRSSCQEIADPVSLRMSLCSSSVRVCGLLP